MGLADIVERAKQQLKAKAVAEGRADPSSMNEEKERPATKYKEAQPTADNPRVTEDQYRESIGPDMGRKYSKRVSPGIQYNKPAGPSYKKPTPTLQYKNPIGPGMGTRGKEIIEFGAEEVRKKHQREKDIEDIKYFRKTQKENAKKAPYQPHPLFWGAVKERARSSAESFLKPPTKEEIQKARQREKTMGDVLGIGTKSQPKQFHTGLLYGGFGGKKKKGRRRGGNSGGEQFGIGGTGSKDLWF